MLDLCRMILWAIVDLFRPRAALEAEILVLRQQNLVLRRCKPGRLLIFGRRQNALELGLSLVSESPRCARHRSSRHCYSMAPCRFPIVLALRKSDISVGQIFPFTLQHRVRHGVCLP
jgi:hypothetical protein